MSEVVESDTVSNNSIVERDLHTHSRSSSTQSQTQPRLVQSTSGLRHLVEQDPKISEEEARDLITAALNESLRGDMFTDKIISTSDHVVGEDQVDYNDHEDDGAVEQEDQHKGVQDHAVTAEEVLKRKVISLLWLDEWLTKGQNPIRLLNEDSKEGEALRLNAYDTLKSGVLLCTALNNILLANPKFVEENLPPIEVNEKKDLFAEMSNLTNFIRTCELYFNVDRFRIFDPIDVLRNENENALINGVYFVKLVLEQTSVAPPFDYAKPYAALTFEQLSTLITMITSKPFNPVVAYDPRVVLSVQDLESFQRLVGKLEQVEASNKSLFTIVSSMTERLDKVNAEQNIVKNKLESLVEGVLGAFEDVSAKLNELKSVTDLIGNSATGLQNMVQTMEQRRKSFSSHALVDGKKSNAQLSPTNNNLAQIRSNQNLKGPNTFPSAVSEVNQRNVETPQRAPAMSTPPTVGAATLASSTASPVSAGNPFGPSAVPKIFKLPKEVLDLNLSKEEVMRQSVLYEFIDSEADFVRDLNVLLEVHLKDIKNKRLLQDKDLKTLFSNIEEILPVNQKLLQILVARRDEKPVIDGMGDLLLQVLDQFNIYDIYCANYPVANSLYKELKTKDDFKVYIEKSMQNPECKGLTLESYLIKPVQRICKYPLLLRELLKHTPPGHKDKQLLEQSMTKIEEIVTAINERTRAAGDRDKLIDLQNKIDANPMLDLVQTGRRVIRDGMIQRLSTTKTKDRFVVLVTDYLIICKSSMMNKVRYQFEQALELTKVSISPVPPMKFFNASTLKFAKTSFEIVYDKNESFVMNCTTEAERAKWVQLIEDAVKEQEKKPLLASLFQGQHSSSNSGTIGRSFSKNNSSASMQSNASGGSNLKKSNTLSMRKRPSLWRKKDSSNENLAEDVDHNGDGGVTAPTFNSGTNSSEASGKKNNQYATTYSGQKSSSRPTLNGAFNPPEAETSQNNTQSNNGVAVIDAAQTSQNASSKPETSNATQPESTTEQANSPQTTEVPGFPDWRCVDAGKGTVYYYNTSSNETSWYHPSALQQLKNYTPAPTQEFENLSPEDAQKLYEEKLRHMQQLQAQAAALSATAQLPTDSGNTVPQPETAASKNNEETKTE